MRDPEWAEVTERGTGRRCSPTDSPSDGGAQLIRLDASDSGIATYRIPASTRITLGRGQDATIRIDHPDVSRLHAALVSDSAVTIEDTESRNGTMVNGIPVSRRRLRYGDRIQLGSQVCFVFTRRYELEEHLERLQKVDSFVQVAGGLAHDFRNMLAVMVGGLDLLRSASSLESRYQEALDDMRVAVERSSELANRLLTFSTLDSSDGQLADLSALAGEVETLVRRLLPPNVAIESRIEPGLFVRGNASRIHQVLMNLCVNARDALGDAGTLAIAARAIRLSPDPAAIGLPAGDYVMFSVRDDGVGMSPETQARAIEPFYTTKSTGTGLGLATCYGIVHRYNGLLTINSEVGRGTEVTVYLPNPISFAGGCADKQTVDMDSPFHQPP